MEQTRIVLQKKPQTDLQFTYVFVFFDIYPYNTKERGKKSEGGSALFLVFLFFWTIAIFLWISEDRSWTSFWADVRFFLWLRRRGGSHSRSESPLPLAKVLVALFFPACISGGRSPFACTPFIQRSECRKAK
jgi:hypothetical protein